MKTYKTLSVLIILGLIIPLCFSDTGKSEELAGILKKMEVSTRNLKSCKADMVYLFIQDPELLDSRTLRKGELLYNKDKNGSKLRINFNTVKQDDEETQKRPEYYLFDGVWLQKVDMKLETIDLYQKAPENKPVDVFEFISHNFPMVGFTEPNMLNREFIITVKEYKPEKPEIPIRLHLKVRKDSKYEEDYTNLEVWVSQKTYLPVKMTAESTQGDFYELKWEDLKTNIKLENKVFIIETPANFRKNVHPLD